MFIFCNSIHNLWFTFLKIKVLNNAREKYIFGCKDTLNTHRTFLCHQSFFVVETLVKKRNGHFKNLWLNALSGRVWECFFVDHYVCVPSSFCHDIILQYKEMKLPDKLDICVFHSLYVVDFCGFYLFIY